MAEQSREARAHTALVIIDMVNDMDFAEGDDLLREIETAVDAIAALRRHAAAAAVPVIFVNDNFGRWHADRSGLIAYVEGTRGAEVLDRLRPREDEYFIVKPQVSGFYATNLQVLLPQLGVSRLILTGVAADICVLFTAADAHMRQYRLWVPRDAVASNRPEHRDWALGIMEKSMGAETQPSDEAAFRRWLDA